VRLRAHLTRVVKVRSWADTVGPVTERNCIGATSPGGEQREVNDQSATGNVNSIRPETWASSRVKGEAETKYDRRRRGQWKRPATGNGGWRRNGWQVGWRESGNHGARPERKRRGQSARSSDEASNDRGAKGRRKVVGQRWGSSSRKGQTSAARLVLLVRRKAAPGDRHGGSVSGALGRASTEGLDCVSRVRSSVGPLIGKPDAGKLPVRFGREGEGNTSSYPHQNAPA
jgi:hypothetical protein